MWVARHHTSETSQLQAVKRQPPGNAIKIGIRTLDLRFRQGMQALETHRLLLEDLDSSETEPGALPESPRSSLGWSGRILLERCFSTGRRSPSVLV